MNETSKKTKKTKKTNKEFVEIKNKCILTASVKLENRVFSLRWPASMQIDGNKRKCLHKKRVKLPEDWFGTPT